MVEKKVVEDIICDSCKESMHTTNDLAHGCKIIAEREVVDDDYEKSYVWYEAHFCERCYERMLHLMNIKMEDIKNKGDD